MRLPHTLLVLATAWLEVLAAPTDSLSASSFYVPSLPGLWGHPPSLKIWAGHINSDPDAAKAKPTDVTSHLYFVLTKARRTLDKERVVFWFNGGPGCSSFDGLMMEVGPWRMDGKGGLKFQEGGWEEYTHVVYVDQPAGTGFSYASSDKYVHELTDAAQQFLIFLDHFYKVFPELQTVDTFLTGESFAGQYIPYYADAMINAKFPVPLKGVAIGNGWMDGRRQYPSFLEYAVKHGLLKIDTPEYTEAKKISDGCMNQLSKDYAGQDPINTNLCERVLGAVLDSRSRTVNGTDLCTNIYDVRLEDTLPACGMNWPPDLAGVTKYLGRSDVVAALHATEKPTAWEECKGRVHQEMFNKNSKSAHLLLPGLLEKIEVLLFAGDQDFICNYMGIEAMIAALEWNGAKGLGTVQTQSWSVNDTAAGTWVSSRNLTYAKIFNASHMVGFDVPHVSHDMILRFMGVDFSAFTNGTARIPSAIGENRKPSVVFAQPDASATAPSAGKTKTPEMDKAMWEAYYNAGSAALVLLLVLVAIAVFFWCRRRRARSARAGITLPRGGGADDEEESIPLSRSVQDGHDTTERAPSRMNGSSSGNGNAYHDAADTRVGMTKEGKGKGRAQEAIFDVGSDDEK